MKTQLITIDPEIHSGTPVFAGTRVPVKTLFDHLEAGDSLEVFLDDFPSVSRELAVAVLEETRTAHPPGCASCLTRIFLAVLRHCWSDTTPAN